MFQVHILGLMQPPRCMLVEVHVKSTARSARLSLFLENQHLCPGLVCVVPAHGRGVAVSPLRFSRGKDIQAEQCGGCCCGQRDRADLAHEDVSPGCSRVVASAWLYLCAGVQPHGGASCAKMGTTGAVDMVLVCPRPWL